jgi:hypothetical protein
MRCVSLVGVIQTLFSTIWAASTWDTKCNTDGCEWRSLTDCTNTSHLRWHNCNSGMTATEILTRIEISPFEGPQSISWHLIGSMLLLAECTSVTKRSSSPLIFRVTTMHPCFGRFMLFDIDILIFIYCIWVSTRWQWSVDLYKIGNRQHKGRNNTQNNTETRNAQNRKQKTNIRHLTVTCVSKAERVRICVALHLRLTS